MPWKHPPTFTSFLLLFSSRLSPPSLCHAFPPIFLQLFICRFNHICVSLSHPFTLHLLRSRVVCCHTGDGRLPEAAPFSSGDVQRRRRGGERTSSSLMQCWHHALADGTSCRSKTTTTHHNRKKPYSIIYSHFDALAS